jgi:short-subunit dehydrogenase
LTASQELVIFSVERFPRIGRVGAESMRRKPSWERALVTGASAGIGRAFASELGRRGCDLVLVARRYEPLEKLASDLSAAYGIEAEPFVADLTDTGALRAVEARLEADENPVDLLVNNAGGASRHAPFLELDRHTLVNDAYLNSLAVLRLTHAAARRMAQRGGGSIVNVSAGVAFYPLPGAAAYGASKAFVNSLSEALGYELRGTGVRVTAICPGFTRTGAQERLGLNVDSVPGLLWMEPEEVAAAALRATERGRRISSLSTIGRLNAFSGRHLPRRLLLPQVAKGQLRVVGR